MQKHLLLYANTHTITISNAYFHLKKHLLKHVKISTVAYKNSYTITFKNTYNHLKYLL